MANFLGLETGDRLLLETGDKLLLEEQSGAVITGNAAVALAAVSVSTAGALTVRGTTSVTLGPVGTVATGAMPIKAAASINLASTSLVAGSAIALRGGAGVTLPGVSLVAAGRQGGAGTAAVGLGNVTLAAAATFIGTTTALAAVQLGGGWSAHEFAHLRRSLARGKKRLRRVATEILEVLPRPSPDDDRDAAAPLMARIEAAIVQLQEATTMSALREIRGRLHAVRVAIETEFDDEEVLLLAA